MLSMLPRAPGEISAEIAATHGGAFLPFRHHMDGYGPGQRYDPRDHPLAWGRSAGRAGCTASPAAEADDLPHERAGWRTHPTTDYRENANGAAGVTDAPERPGRRSGDRARTCASRVQRLVSLCNTVA